MDPTDIFIIVTIALFAITWIVYDFWTAFARGVHTTITDRVWYWSKRYPMIPFITGLSLVL